MALLRTTTEHAYSIATSRVPAMPKYEAAPCKTSPMTSGAMQRSHPDARAPSTAQSFPTTEPHRSVFPARFPAAHRSHRRREMKRPTARLAVRRRAARRWSFGVPEARVRPSCDRRGQAPTLGRKFCRSRLFGGQARRGPTPASIKSRRAAALSIFFFFSSSCRQYFSMSPPQQQHHCLQRRPRPASRFTC